MAELLEVQRIGDADDEFESHVICIFKSFQSTLLKEFSVRKLVGALFRNDVQFTFKFFHLPWYKNEF